jgi:5-(carboxyamino)imidazole ribonucleotide synthase
VIEPGSTIGVLGSGQLGRMFAIAARRMGYRVHTLSPEQDTPTGQVGDVEYQAPYEDLDAVRKFADGVDVVTFEFENVPAATVEAAASGAPVRPSGHVLYTTQNRLREKTFLSQAGLPVAPFAHVKNLAELKAAVATIGLPAVLKTAGWGYDGKGQAIIRQAGDVDAAWAKVGASEAVLEGFVDFEQEASIVAARGLDGEMAFYPLVTNNHQNHILDTTIAPAQLNERLSGEAVEIAREVVTQLEVVGVLCVELFVTREGGLLVNELAPRPHNSGHWTFDACVTSQFEQQLRSICGMRLGSTDPLCAAAMANLLGDLWNDGTPDWAAACRYDRVKLHLYGKSRAVPGRKMGHLTALDANADRALEMVLAARRALTEHCPSDATETNQTAKPAVSLIRTSHAKDT